MVNLTLLLIVPAVGILLIILRRFYEKFVSPANKTYCGFRYSIL